MVGAGEDLGQGGPTSILIITEKTSQARDLRAALGDRSGQILPAEGHLVHRPSPEAQTPWKNWAAASQAGRARPHKAG